MGHLPEAVTALNYLGFMYCLGGEGSIAGRQISLDLEKAGNNFANRRSTELLGN